MLTLSLVVKCFLNTLSLRIAGRPVPLILEISFSFTLVLIKPMLNRFLFYYNFNKFQNTL